MFFKTFFLIELNEKNQNRKNNKLTRNLYKMLIQAAGDFHGNKEKMDIFLEGIEENSPQLAILCGDISSSLEEVVDFLNELKIKAFVVPGNMDPMEMDEAINKSRATNLNRKRIKFNDKYFIGYGGTNFGEFQGKADVVVTHVPPKGLQDRVVFGMHIGNKSLRNFIEETEPKLLICGHVHEDPGYTDFHGTIVLNCSVGKKGFYSLVELDDDVNIEMVGY